MIKLEGKLYYGGMFHGVLVGLALSFLTVVFELKLGYEIIENNQTEYKKKQIETKITLDTMEAHLQVCSLNIFTLT